MPSTYTSLHVHAIFSTHDRFPFLTKPYRQRVHEYLGGVARSLGATPINTGGVEDHVHMLLLMPPTLAIADAMEKIKSNTTGWIHDTFLEMSKFRWQRGYGAFAVSPSRVDAAVEYISRQEEHHRTRTFREEFIEFLVKSGIAYDERYIWT